MLAMIGELLPTGKPTGGNQVSQASGLPTTDSTPTGLLARGKSGDAAAWQWLAGFYGPLVYHWSRQAGLHGTD